MPEVARRRRTWHDLYALDHRAMILGEPGSGKSILCALTADWLLERALGADDAAIGPLPIILNAAIRPRLSYSYALVEDLLNELDRDRDSAICGLFRTYGDAWDWLLGHCRRMPPHLILDGLTASELSERRGTGLRRLIRDWPGPLLMTSRLSPDHPILRSGIGCTDLSIYQLDRLNDREQDDLCRRLGKAGGEPATGDGLARSLDNTLSLRDALRTPRMLALAYRQWTSSIVPPPGSLKQFCNLVVVQLLADASDHCNKTLGVQIPQLQTVAAHVHLSKSSESSECVFELTDMAAALDLSAAACAGLASQWCDAGLVEMVGGPLGPSYQFSSPILADGLAANGYARWLTTSRSAKRGRLSGWSTLLETMRTEALNPRWYGFLLCLTGALDQQEDHSRVEELVAAIAADSRDDTIFHGRKALALRCLAETDHPQRYLIFKRLMREALEAWWHHQTRGSSALIAPLSACLPLLLRRSPLDIRDHFVTLAEPVTQAPWRDTDLPPDASAWQHNPLAFELRVRQLQRRADSRHAFYLNVVAHVFHPGLSFDPVGELLRIGENTHEQEAAIRLEYVLVRLCHLGRSDVWHHVVESPHDSLNVFERGRNQELLTDPEPDNRGPNAPLLYLAQSSADADIRAAALLRLRTTSEAASPETLANLLYVIELDASPRIVDLAAHLLWSLASTRYGADSAAIVDSYTQCFELDRERRSQPRYNREQDTAFLSGYLAAICAFAEHWKKTSFDKLPRVQPHDAIPGGWLDTWTVEEQREDSFRFANLIQYHPRGRWDCGFECGCRQRF